MDAVLERCAGLDVHQETVVACVLHGSLYEKPIKEIKTFSTNTKELLLLADWLVECQVTHVAMESTGIYWKPIWNILECESFELILANAQHIKNLPGRKTDVKDAEWIAQLLRSGLIERSFVPCEEIRDLRDLTRYRKKLLNNCTQEKNRIHKILQDGNVKITTCLSDIFGVSGRNIIEALINGEEITRIQLLSIIKGSVKNKVDDLVDALNGNIRKHHREMINYSWKHLIYLEKVLESLENQIDECLRPYLNEVELLDTIPGVDKKAASVIVAEIGTDMSVFPSDRHLSSWAGISPGNNESAGKKKRKGCVQGNKYLKTILCECAWSASNTKNTRLSGFYWRLVKRMGKKKATIALAHLILRIAYNILLAKEPYKEIGNEYMVDVEKKRESRIIKELEAKGFVVSKVS